MSSTKDLSFALRGSLTMLKREQQFTTSRVGSTRHTNVKKDWSRKDRDTAAIYRSLRHQKYLNSSAIRKI
jgi:hypothetical protein